MVALVSLAGASTRVLKGEDTYKVLDTAIGGEALILVMVADGHGGKEASQFVEQCLLERISSTASDASSSALNLATVTALEQMHSEIRALPGCTAGSTVTVLALNLTRGELSSWNAGDSMAMLVQNLGYSLLGTSHRLEDNPSEQKRVVAAGMQLGHAVGDHGQPVGVLRAWPGGLAVTRGVGDSDCGDAVSPHPAFTTQPLPATGGAVLLCSDGVWDAINQAQAARILLNGNYHSARSAAASITSAAMAQRGLADDITAVVVLFGPPPEEAIADCSDSSQDTSVHAGTHFVAAASALRPDQKGGGGGGGATSDISIKGGSQFAGLDWGSETRRFTRSPTPPSPPSILRGLPHFRRKSSTSPQQPVVLKVGVGDGDGSGGSNGNGGSGGSGGSSNGGSLKSPKGKERPAPRRSSLSRMFDGTLAGAGKSPLATSCLFSTSADRSASSHPSSPASPSSGVPPENGRPGSRGAAQLPWRGSPLTAAVPAPSRRMERGLEASGVQTVHLGVRLDASDRDAAAKRGKRNAPLFPRRAASGGSSKPGPEGATSKGLERRKSWKELSASRAGAEQSSGSDASATGWSLADGVPAPSTRVIKWESLEVGRLLGEGEFATAHASHLDGKPVALKMLKASRRDEFYSVRGLKREIMLMTIMDHPNVLPGLALGMHEGKPFMIVERVQTTLQAELPGAYGETPFWVRWRGCRKWPLTRALHCGIELADALHYIQNDAVPGSRVLHRDIKPANIGFLEDGRLVLFDFGLATLWHIEAEDGSLNETNRMLTGETGSLRYMAPEVAQNKPYGPKAEVFSFASVLWEMGAHAKPFAELEPSSFVRVISGGGRPRVPKKWPRELRELLAECWDLDAGKRPWFNQIASRLEALLSQLQGQKEAKKKGQSGGGRAKGARGEESSAADSGSQLPPTGPGGAGFV